MPTRIPEIMQFQLNIPLIQNPLSLYYAPNIPASAQPRLGGFFLFSSDSFAGRGVVKVQAQGMVRTRQSYRDYGTPACRAVTCDNVSNESINHQGLG